MMEKMKEYYDGDLRSFIVDLIMYVIYMMMIVISYFEIIYIIIDVVVRHHGLDGRGTFVFQMFGTLKDQILMWFGNPIKSYLDNLVSDLDFRSDARL